MIGPKCTEAQLQVCQHQESKQSTKQCHECFDVELR